MIQTERLNSFPAPSGDRCTISTTTSAVVSSKMLHIRPFPAMFQDNEHFKTISLSSGTCSANLRIYIAAILLYHALIDWVSLLLFWCLSVKASCRSEVPLWDLVLEGLVGTPFKPLELVHVERLTLKFESAL